jgi:hypothetical protein
MIPGSRSASCWWPWPQAVDQSQDLREQPPWNCDLGKLERDVPPVTDDLAPTFTSFSRSMLSDHSMSAIG